MISPRSQSDTATQYVPVSAPLPPHALPIAPPALQHHLQHQHMPPAPENQPPGHFAFAQSHQQHMGSSSSVSSLGQAPPLGPQLMNLPPHGQNYTTNPGPQQMPMAGGFYPAAPAPGLYHDQMYPQQQQPPQQTQQQLQQPQQQPQQPGMFPYFPVLQDYGYPQQHSLSGSSLPTLSVPSTTSHSVSEERFPGTLDQSHFHTTPSLHPRAATYPTDSTKSSGKRSSSASSSGSQHGMSEETARRNRCKVCHKQFKRPSSLQTHSYSHTGEKPFRCDWKECGRTFSVRSNMIRHRKLHIRDSTIDAVDDKSKLELPPPSTGSSSSALPAPLSLQAATSHQPHYVGQVPGVGLSLATAAHDPYPSLNHGWTVKMDDQ